MIIGLTGGIASGKSTIAKWFAENDFAVIDADVSARKVVEPNEEAFRKIVEAFGENILAEDGTIDRAQLGALIFADEEKRKILNEIVHPAVRKDMLEQKENALVSGKQTVVLDIPLLFESKLQWMVDKIIVVYVDYETQLQRLMNRNQYSKEEALMRISSQLSLEEKRKQADAVIDNSGSIEEAFEQLTVLLTKWNAMK
ncbi:dephospho-CoA kinase [Jeotgalibacillus proteolyticus]|uniref:Dephospho-CoA kinase n=1 Tax=Jeotgalibacillus proteolyticus TaxID=2082395 RepID=A0A2S5GF06_9BACL|nr:dephospho-CoA kinase [Jeotgalibacillus proteolyticus]PPA71610.1 dephospho-CoA kinase [Jeotgalibacillus proteolyticus]